ncbi:MAG: DUF4397 domain-containing protein [Gammaproteobacteria bacterium]|nr:DUF4397 domain-containing protein [Gammaproteobacteria bacterium]
MRRFALVALAIVLASCVSSQTARNGGFRFVNAVADSARMTLRIDDEVRAAGFDYPSASTFLSLEAGEYAVKFEENLPRFDKDGDDDIDEDDGDNIYTLFDTPAPDDDGTLDLSLDVNQELTWVLAGHHGAEQVIVVEGRTEAVPQGQTKVRVVHAAVGAPAIDVYFAPEDTEAIGTLEPLEEGLAYTQVSVEAFVPGGPGRLLITLAGSTGIVFDSGNISLSLSGSLIFVLVPSLSLQAADFPFNVVLASGTAATTLGHRDLNTHYRLVNASPGTYPLDVFVNKVTDATSNTNRQDCPIPDDPDDDFVAGYCALPYEFIGNFVEEPDPDSYRVKVQKSAATGVTAKLFVGTFPGGTASTLMFNGLVADSATNVDVISLATLTTPRRVAPTAQLRIITWSNGLLDEIEGDPTTDQIDIFITDDADDVLDDDAYIRLGNQGLGSDTSYLSVVPGDYRLTIAKVDTAGDVDTVTPLYAADVELDGGGVYAIVFNDTAGGDLPLRLMQLEDDPGLVPVP